MQYLLSSITLAFFIWFLHKCIVFRQEQRRGRELQHQQFVAVIEKLDRELSSLQRDMERIKRDEDPRRAALDHMDKIRQLLNQLPDSSLEKQQYTPIHAELFQELMALESILPEYPDEAGREQLRGYIGRVYKLLGQDDVSTGERVQ